MYVMNDPIDSDLLSDLVWIDVSAIPHQWKDPIVTEAYVSSLEVSFELSKIRLWDSIY